MNDNQYNDFERLYRVIPRKQPRDGLKIGSSKLLIPGLFVAFGIIFVITFRFSSEMRTKWNVPVTLTVFLVAVCLLGAEALNQMRSEYSYWAHLKKDFELSDWINDPDLFNPFGFLRVCHPCDQYGIYYVTSHSVEAFDIILHLACKPVLIPWNDVESVHWEDSQIFIALSTGEQLETAASDYLFEMAEENLPPGAVTYVETQ